MLTQVKLADIAGKTVSAIDNCGGDSLYIVFTDGTFVAARAKASWGSTEIEDSMIDLAVRDWGRIVNAEWAAKCVELGIYTQQEFDAALAEEKRVQNHHQLANKRAQLEKLKKELGE